jgi:hypothetical protein
VPQSYTENFFDSPLGGAIKKDRQTKSPFEKAPFAFKKFGIIKY